MIDVQILIYGLVERCQLGVSLKPFQRLVGAAAIGGRASQGAKHLFRRFSFVSFSFAPAVSKEKRKAIQNVFK